MDFGSVKLRGPEPKEAAPWPEEPSEADIAIIGIGLKLPFAETEAELLELLRAGKDAVRPLPARRKADADGYYRSVGEDPAGVRYGEAAYLDEIDRFDYAFFKLSPKEAGLLDPNQRLFLETAWHALEDAGLGGRSLEGSHTGVYVGYGSDADYKRMIDRVEPESASMAMPGNVRPIIASRLSYLLDLRGPSLIVDTTCSSSLVAVHMACQALRAGECELAIAGGIQLHLLPVREFEVGIESSTGRTRTFDDAADGTGTGEGAAAVVLKPLRRATRDRDPIYAVIKSSAVNQDGNSVGITAPNADAQADVISEAWRLAGIRPETVGFIEAHGTGTKLGDPVELEGIRRAFARFTDRKQFCAVGSVKSNFGHLDNAAGIAGLLKAVLSLKHRLLFPTLHVERPNRNIPFVESPAYINTRLTEWEEGEEPLRCGVSSFGISGTNCHVVLEQAPKRPAATRIAPSGSHSEAEGEPAGHELLLLSARSEAALLELARRCADFLDANGQVPLADVCYTAAAGRGHYPYRLAVVAGCHRDSALALRSAVPDHVRGPCAADGAASQALKEAIRRFVREGRRDPERLTQLGRLYMDGADADWRRLYEGREVAKVNLPAYPFERKRCWLRLPAEADAENSHEAFAGGKTSASSLYHRLEWRQKPLVSRKPAPGVLPPICLVSSGEPLAALLAARLRTETGAEVTEASVGTQGKQGAMPISRYAEAFRHLFESTSSSGPRRIVLLDGGEAAEPGEVPGMGADVHRLLGLLRTLAEEPSGRSAELFLVSNRALPDVGTHAQGNPDRAALFAMAKAVHWEMPHVRVRCIDYGDEAEDLAGLVAELSVPPHEGGEYKTAYRLGARYVERVCEWELPSEPKDPVGWRTEGVYVITGGLGGIGLLAAARIAAQGPVRIALLNRSAFPPREEWETLACGSPDSETTHRIRAIRDMERSGARVECIRADVSDEHSLREALDGLRKRHGRINAVVHAAGIGDGDYLARLTEDGCEKAAAAKTRGAWLLDQLTSRDEPDFFVMFSSAITLVGGIGSGPYAAANAWLDAYAANRRAEGCRMLSIGWPAWDRTGLSAADAPDERKELFRLLPADRGVDAFEELLGVRIAHALVGEWNRDGLLFELEERLPFRLEEEAAASWHRKASEASGAASRHAAPIRQVKLKGKTGGGGCTEIETKVASAWMQVLGYEELGVDDNFFELGGDSILITRLHAHIRESFPGRTTIADLFAFPTIAKLSAFLQASEEAETGRNGAAQEEPAASAAVRGGNGTDREPGRGDSRMPAASDIAVIGLTVRLPDAPDLDALWANLETGRESIGPYPAARQGDASRFILNFTDVKEDDIRFSHGGYLDSVDGFDSGFFQLSPREASLMDPNQRLFLEACWEAIEDAGYGGRRLKGTRTGVYLGYADWPVYGQYITKKFPPLIHAAGAGNTPSLIASRISYLLDLQGPAILVDTACSSSLVAVHMACRAIRSGECDMAIAGGVKVCLMPVEGVFEIGIESSRRQTRAFDDDSDGTVWGEGTVALLLKPLERALADRDRVYAVIKGTAINQDGSSAGITAPNAQAQEKVLVQAWEDAGIDPETIAYIETHGTGTKLGDPIEIDGIQRAFGRYTDKKQFCAIGSVKSNIGHLDSASGVAGLAKAIASLTRRQLAPTLHFERPNRNIAFERSPVYVADRPSAWETDGVPRRCGVSSFGFSGTNCHVILEEAPPDRQEQPTSSEPEQWRILALSGKNAEALRQTAVRYREFLAGSRDRLDDICATANAGRGHYSHRLAFVFRNRNELRHLLDKAVEDLPEGGFPAGVYRGEHRLVAADREKPAPGQLTPAVRIQWNSEAAEAVESLRSGADVESWRELARLYAAGADVDWERLYEGTDVRKVRVPIYPFQRARCWIEPEPAANAAAESMRPSITVKGRENGRYEPLELLLAELWGRLLGVGEIDVHDDFFELGGHSLLTIEMETELERKGIKVDADDLYRYRSVGRLAEYIAGMNGPSAMRGIAEPPAEPVTEPVRMPERSPVQAATEDEEGLYESAPERHYPLLLPLAAQAAETLVLPGMEPFNDIFYRNCFFNSTFPVVRSFGRSIAPFLANDLIVYEGMDGTFSAGYVSVRPIGEVFGMAGLAADIRYGSDNIVVELLEHLSAGKPTVVWVDCYYESIRPDAYRKQHIDHTLLVFGFDRRERLFHIVEHDRRENLSYRRRTLPFDEMARAFEGFDRHYVQTGLHAATHYVFSPSGGADTDPVGMLARNLETGRRALEESLNALDRFIAEYARHTESAARLKTSAEQWVAFMNEAVAAKQTERYRLELMLPGAERERMLIDEALAGWDYVRKGVARFMYGGEFRAQTFAAGLERLYRLAEAEGELMRSLPASLETHAKRIL
ncbi:SDR family NAD(P)-dependent oxidoreductase [Cohnella sp. CFH 77786]|uniref:SDR family NAD(P)-dependent oxidoreductase n=1 Tax=Cohnella sp. CFH 77786 TaxID=2662265 RepID=UPI001C60CE38|nr:SDR family NAD(P)-dependent oxidoreductase [Cohnella sp. CFH 77786]MBW5446414.1 SDR family NAD(P)-dependent oxidoreductase [Cohnella sp. CFH 77786]